MVDLCGWAHGNYINYILTCLFLARNAIVVIISASIAYALASQGKDDVFTLVNKLPKGIPSVKAPTIDKEVFKVDFIYCCACKTFYAGFE